MSFKFYHLYKLWKQYIANAVVKKAKTTFETNLANNVKHTLFLWKYVRDSAMQGAP